MTEAAEKVAHAHRAKPGTRVVAERYARALLEVALDKKTDLDRIGKELQGFQALLEREGALEAALASPTIPTAKRVAILEAVLASAKVAPETLNLLRLLARNDRIPLVDVVAESFHRLVLEHKQIQPGEVVSAHPLSSDQKERLAGQLGQALGKTMDLSYRTNPEILGGVVVRVGNRVFDASVTTQLRRFKEEALSRH
ncbi:MAG: ATP synthase F1 subunit delta [Vicinamibacteria bacterium]